MLPCRKCGADNPLGRVFCGACGAKLDLANADREIEAARVEPQRRRERGCGITVVVVLLVAVALGLALWPNTGELGAPGRSAGARRVDSQLRALRRVRPGTRLGATFRESDLNGYLRLSKARNLRVESLSISIKEDRFTVRMVRRLASFSVGDLGIVPKVSLDFVCTPDGRG